MNLYDEIASLAYELYEKNGRIEGCDLDNWLEAERIVISRYTPQETNTEAVKSPKKVALRTNKKSLKQKSKGQKV